MKIDTLDVLTPTTAQAFANRIRNSRRLWIPRGGFYTVGASTYLDSPEFYPVFAHYTNPMVESILHDLQFGIMEALPERFVPHAPRRMHGTAVMGFHIFDFLSNGAQGKPHIDGPFKRCDWGVEYANPFSFTLALELPEVGGGFDYWEGYSDYEIEYYAIRGAAELPDPVRFPYEVGKLYVHDGLTPHRIANFGDMKPDECRITIQGHGVTLADGVTAIYF